MAVRRCIVIGGSAGSIGVLKQLASRLPADLAAPAIVVVHIPAHAPGRLPEVLGRHAAVAVCGAQDGEVVRAGRMYVAPPDRHVTIHDGRLEVRRGPRHNRHRPAIDVLFTSAAMVYGPGTVGVILSGGPGDGVDGARDIAAAGGQVLVQDPDGAIIPFLPEAVLRSSVPAEVVTDDDLAARIAEIVTTVPTAPTLPLEGVPGGSAPHGDGGPLTFTYGCPDCGGVLELLDPPGLLRYRCRVGHTFTADGLLEAMDDALEGALWAAVRGLEERADLSDDTAGRPATALPHATRLRGDAADARGHADVIRDFLTGRPPSGRADRSS